MGLPRFRLPGSGRHSSGFGDRIDLTGAAADAPLQDGTVGWAADSVPSLKGCCSGGRGQGNLSEKADPLKFVAVGGKVDRHPINAGVHTGLKLLPDGVRIAED